MYLSIQWILKRKASESISHFALPVLSRFFHVQQRECDSQPLVWRPRGPYAHTTEPAHRPHRWHAWIPRMMRALTCRATSHHARPRLDHSAYITVSQLPLITTASSCMVPSGFVVMCALFWRIPWDCGIVILRVVFFMMAVNDEHLTRQLSVLPFVFIDSHVLKMMQRKEPE